MGDVQNGKHRVDDFEISYNSEVATKEISQPLDAKVSSNKRSLANQIKNIIDGLAVNSNCEISTIIDSFKRRKSKNQRKSKSTMSIRVRDINEEYRKKSDSTKTNRLGIIGKIYLENMRKGKHRRNIQQYNKDSIELSYPLKNNESTFEAIRKHCKDQNILYEDPTFPANATSLAAINTNVVWKRPGEIVKHPQLIVQGESRFDVKQGRLGDCWFLAALANLTQNDALFYRVVAPDQSFDPDHYAGVFHFQFWHFGEWLDVVIDDRLPTINNQLIYMHSESNNEFWSALVEKAYAKLHGGYKCLDGGTTAEALEDLTGGLTEYLDLREVDKQTVLATMIKSIEMGSLFACAIDLDGSGNERRLPNGLICSHSYTVTGIHLLPHMALIRLRNPWGNENEWKGAWSDGSSEWRLIDVNTREQLDVRFANDGEFWMSFDDFYRNFTQLEVCHLSADIFAEISEMTGIGSNSMEDDFEWNEVHIHGEWSKKLNNAGGCRNNDATFYTNPKYHCQLSAPAHSIEEDGKVTVIFAILQKMRRSKCECKQSLPIGITIYKIGEFWNKKDFGQKFYQQNRAIAATRVYVNTREATVNFRAPPGHYLIVPCTFEPNCETEFLLRAFANGPLVVNEIK